MSIIEKEIGDVENKVTQNEALAGKLENQMIELNVLGKLAKRNEELREIGNAASELQQSINVDLKLLDGS